MKYLYLFIFFLHQCYSAGIMDNVIYAVNCGGEAHTDINGNDLIIKNRIKIKVFFYFYF